MVSDPKAARKPPDMSPFVRAVVARLMVSVYEKSAPAVLNAEVYLVERGPDGPEPMAIVNVCYPSPPCGGCDRCMLMQYEYGTGERAPQRGTLRDYFTPEWQAWGWLSVSWALKKELERKAPPALPER
jgi:hypothetical protein